MPSPYYERCTINDGGYVKKGNMVFFDIKITILLTSASDYVVVPRALAFGDISNIVCGRFYDETAGISGDLHVNIWGQIGFGYNSKASVLGIAENDVLHLSGSYVCK